MNVSVLVGRRPLDPSHDDFPDLSALEARLLKAVGGPEAFVEKFRGFFRSAIDEVIDTARSRRFCFSELEKTEKTYLGTKFEILLRDWLKVPRGNKLDLKIGRWQVDVKSTTIGHYGWMIPPEARDELCVLLRVNELTSKCAVGLIRARSAYLRNSTNRDKKTSISAAGRQHVWWIISDYPYTPNFWAQVSDDDRALILERKAGGTTRIARLFELYQEIPVSRVQVQAVAAQDDFMKRVRRNSGARDILAPKGVAILYSGNPHDRVLLQKLGVEFGSREFISYRAKTPAEVQILRAAKHID